MANENGSRSLAPDTKWLLPLIGGAFVAVLSVTQYQLNSLKDEQRRGEAALKDMITTSAELMLERTRGATVTRAEIDEMFRPRDAQLKRIATQVAELQVGGAKLVEGASAMNTMLERIVKVTIDTQGRAAETEGRLKELLSQIDSNAKLLGRILDQQVQSAQTLSERVTRLESRTHPGPVVGVP